MATSPKSAALKKSPTTASTAVAVKKSANIVSIQDALRAQVEDLNNRVAPATGNMIRATQDKKFILPDGTKTEGPLQLVIVDFVGNNNYYPEGFDPNNIVPPVCYSLGKNIKTMAPMANSPEPQSDSCATCPQNAWESGKGGKGKACNNERLLAVLPPDADADTPIWLLKASKTAIKGFDSYVAGIARTFQSMPISVVTTVGFNDAVTYPSLEFTDPAPNPNIAEHFARQAEAAELLNRERDMSGYEAPVKAPASRKGARR